MDTSEVRIVRLEPMRVACFNGFGPGPEEIALNKMLAWVKARQLLADGQVHRFFGYDNPMPTPGSPNYGYDMWVTIGPAVTVDGEAKLVNFAGGLYAVAGFAGHPMGIPAAWKKLMAWVEQSRYRPNDSIQWLEEHFNPPVPLDQLRLDLHLPIAE